VDDEESLQSGQGSTGKRLVKLCESQHKSKFVRG
jgi:hypothetical protein